MQNKNIYHFEGGQLEDQEKRESLRVERVNAYDGVVHVHGDYYHNQNSC